MFVSVVTFFGTSMTNLYSADKNTPETTQQEKAVKEDPAEQTVYATKTGTKYHADGCKFLGKSKVPMKLKDAVKQYTPCSVCNPPVLKDSK